MKNKLITALTLTGLALALAVGASLVGGPITVIGDGACAKCQLKEGKECQATVSAMEDGKKITYYLRDNAATKEIGRQLCVEHKQLRVTGTVQAVDGRFELIPTKVEIVKTTL